MEIYGKEWKEYIFDALCQIAPQPDLVKQNVSPDDILTETPPDPALGDIAFPLFPFAKIMKQAPAAIGENLISRLQGKGGSVSVAGPYLNVKLERERIFKEVLEILAGGGDTYGANKSLSGQRVMVEFSCPNTNKPLHLGHVRNGALGMAISNLQAAAGRRVLRANLVNDRGVHICKSMLAWQKWGAGATPESAGKKGDGLARKGRYVIYVPGSAKGTQVKVRIDKVSGNMAFGTRVG